MGWGGACRGRREFSLVKEWSESKSQTTKDGKDLQTKKYQTKGCGLGKPLKEGSAEGWLLAEKYLSAAR